MSQEASVDVPPPSGAKLNVEEMALCVTEETRLNGQLEQTDRGEMRPRTGPAHHHQESSTR